MEKRIELDEVYDIIYQPSSNFKFFFIILIFLLLFFIGVYFYKKYVKNNKLPKCQVLLNELILLKQLEIPVSDKYYKLTEITKNYLLNRFNLNYISLTDVEIKKSLEFSNLSIDQKDLLQRIFEEADIKKYSQNIKNNQIDDNIDQIINFIQKTKIS